MAGCTCGFCLAMLAWLRSSSHEPMVAARLASLPFLPTGVPEDAGGAGFSGTLACLFNMDRGVQSGTATGSTVKGKQTQLCYWDWNIHGYILTLK